MKNEIEFKMNFTSRFLIFGGFVFAIISAARYWVSFPDLDKLVAYTFIGLIISILGWLHSRVDVLNRTNEAQWKYLDKIARRGMK